MIFPLSGLFLGLLLYYSEEYLYTSFILLSVEHDYGFPPYSLLNIFAVLSPHSNRLVGLVGKASASRAEDPGFESRLRRDFYGVESYQ